MMRRILFATVTALTALAVAAGCSTGSDAVSQTAGDSNRYVPGDGKTIVYQPDQRKPAPVVTGATLGGGDYTLSAHRGSVVVINFWAAWCSPCRLESTALEDTYKATEASGVDFLGVNSRDEKDEATSFESERLTYPSLFDPSGKIALRFSDVPPTALPCTLIIDRNGKIAVVIRAPVTQQKLTPLINQVLAE